MDTRPALLLLYAREQRGTSQLGTAELRDLARQHWPARSDEWIDDVVERAVAQRDAGQRRIDPATVPDLRHPSVRERQIMPDTTKVRAFIADLIADEPDISNDDINAHVNKRFDADLSQQQTSAYARFIRAEAGDPEESEEAEPSTNGARPPAPADPSAAEAGPETATDATEGGGQPTGRIPARRTPREVATEEPPTSRAHPVEHSERVTMERRMAYGPRTNRVQVDVDPATGAAHLFLDIAGLSAGDAYRIAAQAQLALAELGDRAA